MDTVLDRNNVADRINNIFINRFNKDLKTISPDYETDRLLGLKFGFEPRDLVYLFFEVEKEFNIRIPQDAVQNGKFKTIQGIIDTVLCQSKK